MTNFERIKAMSVEEFADEWFNEICIHINWCRCEGDCSACVREWLESEVQDEAD